jgi:c-di-GMP-binding flagellar brake protein YcgR
MKIVSYIRVNLGQADFQDELATLFDSISPRLKREIVDYIFETCCRSNKFLD